ncbi:uncharacterized protein Dana_GF19515 [Drosophila ananassae]|uniref:Chromatin accessibility complex protein 1 n=1 Tax=Drosophila ananassae TaxID=7217 RepID=B3MXT4_DROAN|nr:chromatin accessibility complex 16kD protein [Drosophila ananassae]EDV38549.1 uncharacterized protein Dana_GF19515 [Drosophila ananassae]KAH8347634.1 hypothetical protein KR067_008953 [Drosophila pandora]
MAEQGKQGRTPSSDTFLPLSRVRTIMKSSMDTGLITNEVLFLMTKCTEMFVQHLASEAYKDSFPASKQPSSDTLKYDHLSQLVNKSKNLEFLLQIVPEKIRVHEFQEMLRLNRSGGSDEDDDSGSGSGSESDE